MIFVYRYIPNLKLFRVYVLRRGSEVAIKRGENTEAAIEDMKEEADSWLEISDHPNILR